MRTPYNRHVNEPTKPPRIGRHLWNWLLLVPLALLIYPGLYARTTPELFGFPFFYWYQFAAVLATALLTGVVYWATRSPEDNNGA